MSYVTQFIRHFRRHALSDALGGNHCYRRFHRWACVGICYFVVSSALAVAPCGDTVTINGASATWASGCSLGDCYDVPGVGEAYYFGSGVATVCDETSPSLVWKDSVGAFSYYQNASGWAHCNLSDALTSFDLGSCGSYPSEGGTPTPTPTATPESSPPIIDLTNLEAGQHQTNQFVICLLGMVFFAVLSFQVRP